VKLQDPILIFILKKNRISDESKLGSYLFQRKRSDLAFYFTFSEQMCETFVKNIFFINFNICIYSLTNFPQRYVYKILRIFQSLKNF